jgi:hypothetical protein
MQSRNNPIPETKEPKKRHGCLTDYLIGIILGAIGLGIYNITGARSIKSTLPFPGWAIIASAVLEIY